MCSKETDMSKYYYRCKNCGDKIPEMQLHTDEGFVHHIVGEKEPLPCGPVGKVTVIENPPKLHTPEEWLT
jgi:hypothetical protein